MIRALVFDFDGLIIDTEVSNFQAWAETYRDHGCNFPEADFAPFIGTTGKIDFLADLERRIGRPLDREAVRAAKRRREDALADDQPLLPGVAGAIREARRRGLKLAVASSSYRAWVEGHLDRRGLLPFFDVLRCRDDVTDVKPDPALYRSALEALAAGPGEAIAFEDSPNGIHAAKGAGLFCVAVPNPLTAGLDLARADLRIGSLEEISLAEILKRFS